MPRDLSDVLHYFLPEFPPKPGGESDPTPETPETARPLGRRNDSTLGLPPRRRGFPPRRESARIPLSILGVPLGEHDVVHAAYTWNLALETARLGGESAIVVPEIDRDRPLWPATRPGLLDVEIVYSAARDLAGLRRDALETAESRGRAARRGGIVFTRIPPAWLALPEDPQPAATARTGSTGDDWIRWLLLFSSARRRDVEATFARVQQWVRARPGLEIGVTICGVREIAEARDAFDELARCCDTRLGMPLASYGLLVDDLDVYRAIASGRPIGSAQPSMPAARALGDAARLLYEDARSRVLG